MSERKQFDPWGILYKTDKPAEQAWEERHGPPRRKRNAAAQTEPKFQAFTLDDRIQLGYGVAVADVDGDKWADVLLADKKQFVWYRNPGAERSREPGAWQKFLIAENLTQHDNVCLAAQDIDGDGKCELVVGADWNPAGTVNSGAIFHLIAPADRTQPWEPVRLQAEPAVHRMRWVKVEYRPLSPDAVKAVPSESAPAVTPNMKDRLKELRHKWLLVVVPLHGRSDKQGEATGSHILAYQPPAALNDKTAEWKTQLIGDSLHMTHGFHGTSGVTIAAREGIVRYTHRMDETWFSRPRTEDSVAPLGAGEVTHSRLYAGAGFLATIEPIHGNRLMVYVAAAKLGGPLYEPARLLTDQLIVGHALACDDLLDTGSDQIVVGWRGSASQPDGRVGIKMFTPLDYTIDDNTMACEDLQLADLNGDGKLDIVACGRATRNVKIYFNESY